MMRLSFKVGPLVISRSLDHKPKPSAPPAPVPPYRGEGPVPHNPGVLFWVAMVVLGAYACWIVFS